ncbi:hypothetical protein [Nitrosospira sp. Nsp2]|nr:hypothetical protein [Nitrosospira sp. Nsp2]
MTQYSPCWWPLDADVDEPATSPLLFIPYAEQGDRAELPRQDEFLV